MACGDVDRKGGFADVKTRGLDGPSKGALRFITAPLSSL